LVSDADGERTGDGQFNLLRGATDVVRLRQAAEDITQYCENVLRLFRKVYAEKDLENEKTKRYSEQKQDRNHPSRLLRH